MSRWAYGVTTVSSRFKDLLPRTLASLAKAGFDKPRLFIDGLTSEGLPESLTQYDITIRNPNIRSFGNWVLAAWELYLRNPNADMFAIFQDDFVTYPNLLHYLDRCKYPERGYWNLYLWPENEVKDQHGWYASPNQRGLGAVALVFSNTALRTLLAQQHMINRPLDPHRGWRRIDGGIVDSMKEVGYQEWVHNPSLTQHTGIRSSMGNGRQSLAGTFLGEEFDALHLVQPSSKIQTAESEPIKLAGTGRIGLVGYDCDSGLGELNRQLALYAKISGWLVKPHKNFQTKKTDAVPNRVVCGQGFPNVVRKFVSSVDAVLFCETIYYSELLDVCRTLGKRTVCVPMLEWMPAGARGWPKEVNLFICPTKQCYDTFAHVIPCVYFPWPVDIERFQFRQRTRCNRFLFINGHGGFQGRKGADIVRQAKQLWPEMPLAVRAQSKENWPSGTEILPPTDDNLDLYSEGDVLVAPHSVDGLGLEPMEAMACGMPVITTDGLPWNEVPAIARIPAEITKKTIQRPVDWYLPSPLKLVEICKKLLNQDITQYSTEARQWAESRSWGVKRDEFIKLVLG